MTIYEIAAPSDLQQGYPLEIELGHGPVTVSVPKDVKAGETFEGEFCLSSHHTRVPSGPSETHNSTNAAIRDTIQLTRCSAFLPTHYPQLR